jgi:1-acyl-sn-glycerol-3-phosphate acyltransferase
MSASTGTVIPRSPVPVAATEAHDALGLDDAAVTYATRAMRRMRDTYLRRYHRHEIDVDAPVPSEPVLFVGNHGFGGLVDLNVVAAARALRAAEVQRPTTALVHQLAWSLGVGPVVEAMGGRPASKDNADAAFRAGHNLFVFPGGDLDAGKSWRDRDRVVFENRCGFARLAIDQNVPIVPIVTAGAGESLLVLSDGRALAQALRLPRLARTKVLPISVSLGWGLNVGLAGMLPYPPLPTKLHTAVMPPMTPGHLESPEDLAARVQSAMQTRLDTLVTRRRPVVG